MYLVLSGWVLSQTGETHNHNTLQSVLGSCLVSDTILSCMRKVMTVKEGRSHSLEQILALRIPSPPPAYGLSAQRPQLESLFFPCLHRYGIPEFLGLRREVMIFKPG